LVKEKRKLALENEANIPDLAKSKENAEESDRDRRIREAHYKA
jgi:hypothetical protein